KPGPAPTVNVGKPQRFTLPNGMKVMVVENSKLPRVSFNLQLDNGPFVEGSKKGIDDLTSAMMGKGTKTISKDVFNEEIDFLGASINFSANGAYATGLSKYAGRVLDLMAQGCLNPNFTQVEFDKEKAKLIEGLKSNEKSVAAVAGRVENFLTFGKNHPSGEYLTEQTINNVTLTDLTQHYNSYFVPQNAYLVVIGDVKFADVKTKVESAFESWSKGVAPALSYTDPKNLQYTQINFVDMPNAVQSEISLVNTVNLKMTDKDYFAAILANQVLGGDFNSYLNMNLREKHGWTYGARSSISGSKYVTKFKSSSQVRNAVTDSAVVEFMNELKRIRKEKVTNEVLNNVKAGFIGKFVMQIEKPETVARYALATETQKLPADFYENYIKSINAVTTEDVMKAANKYFLADNTRIVIVGKGSEVIPGLEKLKIPMFFFDKWGNPATKTEEKKASADVTVKSILDKYIAAIGGEKSVKAIKTTSSKSSATVQGMPMELSVKTAEGKMLVEMNAMGMTMMKQMVNDKVGYMEQQGQRKAIEGEKLTEMRASAQPFPELALATKTGVTLLPIQNIDGKDAYGIKDGKKTYFYDVATGLRVGTSEVREANGQTMTQTTNFSDYKEVKGVKMPHKTTMNVGIDIELTTTEIKINEGVADADFQ
ncbi:M16 family metallopeptidase, partial [Flavobacterium sp.]|uniref:M16 family metallopeptidase n=1 Tax=Flavobacterium sp. TaxID=239 RepID=UPI00374CE241